MDTKKGYSFWFLDDMPMGRKLLILYIICVFIPIMVINYIFYHRISANIRQQHMDYMETVMDRTGSNIEKSIKDCVGIIYNMYTDQALYDLLDDQYEQVEDYYLAYNGYLKDAVLKYIPVYPQIKKVGIYVDNPTIIQGGSYFYLDEDILKKDWYKSSHDIGNNVMLLTYFDKEPIFLDESVQYFSIVRRLNYYRGYIPSSRIILMKIDLKPDFFSEIINGEGLNGDFYVINERDEIVYSTRSEYWHGNIGQFRPFADLALSNDPIVMVRSFDNIVYLKGWRLVSVFAKDNLISAATKTRNFVLLLVLSSLLVSTLIILLISKSVVGRLGSLSNHMIMMRRQQFEPISCREGNDEVGQLIRDFNQMTLRIRGLIHDVYEADIQKKSLELERKQAELNALQSQINPHFLFNTLNTIRIMSIKNGEREIAEIIKYLANILRRLSVWEDDLVTLREELTLVEELLKIEKYRFKDKISYSIDVEEDILDFRIPKLSIQPLVENAIIHGLEVVKGQGFVRIAAERMNGEILIHVEDNGAGISEDRLSEVRAALIQKAHSDNIGIQNVFRRLSLFYGDMFEFKIESQLSMGTRISLTIPVGRVNAKHNESKISSEEVKGLV